jgi:uncharacterized repeat protein (TIGR02059 family)
MKRLFIVLSLCSAIISVNAQDYSNYTSCALQDSLALVAFYHATGGPNWISNTAGDFSTDYLSEDVLTYYTVDYPNAGLGRWLEGPVKDWFGVTLTKRQIGNTPDSAWRVIHLHPTLSRRSSGENNLVGYVPKEVGWLTALEWFKVNGNVGLKNSEVPDELYHTSIVELDFEGAFFSGILSSALRNCTNLKLPNFRDNYFDSVPVMDFITEPSSAVFFYRNQISWATLEPTVDYLVDQDYSYEARDQKNVGEAREIVVTPGSSVTMESSDAGSHGTYEWYKNGFNTYFVGPTRTINNVSASDTGSYTVLVGNEYIRLNDANADYKNTFTKPIHLTFIPSTPVCEKSYTSYDGNKVYLDFNKPMAIPSTGQKDEFVVLRDGVEVTISDISRAGRKNKSLVLDLGESLFKGEIITISYTKGSVEDHNGGKLSSISGKAVSNMVRETPALVNAITRVDGEGIFLEFNQYMDPETFNPADFTIYGTNPYSVDEIVLVDGKLDRDISKKITLILNDFMLDTDTLYVSYTKGSLAASYGGAVLSFENIPVENVVVTDRKMVNIRVVDGSASLDQVVVKGDFSGLPVIMNDEGVNGDEIAGDNTWTKTLQLTNGNFNWEVYNRTVEITYDTLITTGGSGEIIITLTPVVTYSDSLISSGVTLNVTRTGLEISGDSIFNYRTNSVVFILDLTNYMANSGEGVTEPYLMGIDNDWTSGILMTEMDHSGTEVLYATSVSGYAPGDIINFNYRNADTWENTGASPRSHTVSGNDTLVNEFGVFPVTMNRNMDDENNRLILYPNPASSELSVHYSDGQIPVLIRIINICGQTVLISDNTATPIDISGLQSGMYILYSSDTSGKTIQNKFIKSN